MTDGIDGTITSERVEVPEDEIFVPGEPVVEVVLEPQYEPYEPLPPDVTYKTGLPTPVTKSIVLNIETTGLMPFDSRITHIAAVNIEKPDEILTWFDVDEKKLLREFVNWFEANDFNEIIGYNVSFDYRFLFTKCMRYAIPCPILFDTTLWDVANVMKQVKMAYVFGFNKVGTLDEWAFYLLGLKPPMSQEAAIQAFADKEYDKIADYNKYKVNATLGLWVLIKLAAGEIIVD